MIFNTTLNDYKQVCKLCTIHIVLLIVTFLIIISISSAFIYFHWYLKKDNTIINTEYWNSNLLDIYMGNIKNINIENCTGCFLNDITDIKNFD